MGIHLRETTMKNLLLAGACALALVSLGGCGTLAGGSSNLPATIDALAHAGCTGDLTFSGGASTAAGVSPGSAHVENSFHGACDPRNARATPPVPPAPAPTPAPAPPTT